MDTTLRAPDPTLDALTPTVIVCVDHSDPVPRAHRSTPQGRECAGYADSRLAAEARWFAIPCRTCFPSAPPVGNRIVAEPPDRLDYEPDPHLAWQQVEEREHDSYWLPI